jgi:hypothetical protein
MEAPLEVTYRHGRPFAAYFRLPRQEGDRVDHSRPCKAGLVVDLTVDGRPIGIEITEPSRADAATFNRVLLSLGLEPVDASVLAPLTAA